MRRKNNEKKTVGLIKLMLLLVVIFYSVKFYSVNLQLIGNNILTLEVGSTYEEPGFSSMYFFKNANKDVTVDSASLDTSKIGKYTIIYTLKKEIFTKKTTRVINVVDSSAPVLELNGKEEVTLTEGSKYNESGFTAIDNYDGDITDKVKIDSLVDTSRQGKYTINYSVRDSSGNEARVVRNVEVKRIIEVKGTGESLYSTKVDALDDLLISSGEIIKVGYYNLTNGKTYTYHPDDVIYGASLIKVVDAMYLYDHKMITNNNSPDIAKAITHSDNPAHYRLVNTIGRENLRQYGLSLGAKYTLAGGDPNPYGVTTVSDQLIYWKHLYDIVQHEDAATLKSYFINDDTNNIKFTDELVFMHKYGEISTKYHDVGIVFDEEPYIVIILTNQCCNRALINNISKAIYEYHNMLKKS